MLTDEDKRKIVSLLERGRSSAGLNSSEKLHFYASKYNFDNGSKNLIALLNNALCSKATALMIYWRNGPRYHSKYKSRLEVPAIHISGFDLRMLIQTKFMANQFKEHDIVYDPTNDRGYNWTLDYLEMENLNPIPEEMFRPII